MVKKIVPAVFLLFLFSCKKQMDNFQINDVSNYYPLQVGKYIDYQLDSLVFINFGADSAIVSYQARDIVDAKITDNQGRPGYRIMRYMRKTATDTWNPAFAYSVTVANNRVEVDEKDLRFIKLADPVRQGFSWKGNTFIDTYSVDMDLMYMDDWDYTYDSVDVPLTLNGLNFDNTIKVNQRDEFLGQSPTIPGTQYAEKNFAFEKYAKGVGLIYKEFLHWEYQGAQPGRPAYFDGFGIRMKIIGHN